MQAAAEAALYAMSLPRPPGATPQTDLDLAWLLQTVRAYVDQGRPLEAINTLAQALTVRGDAQQAAAALHEVRQALLDGSAGERSANQLAALLAGLSVAAAGGPLTGQAAQQQQQPTAAPIGGVSGGGNAESMDTDDAQLASSNSAVLAQARVAAAEGASYTCSACGGIVALARRATHEQLWCPGPRE